MTGIKNGSQALKGMLMWHWEKQDGLWGKKETFTFEIPKTLMKSKLFFPIFHFSCLFFFCLSFYICIFCTLNIYHIHYRKYFYTYLLQFNTQNILFVLLGFFKVADKKKNISLLDLLGKYHISYVHDTFYNLE